MQIVRPTPKFEKQGKLPGRPSALIRIALQDLRRAEKNPKYKIDMGVFAIQYPGKCAVCFAGAVMTHRLDGVAPLAKNDPFKVGLLPRHFNEESCALNALDEFRQGQLREAFNYLNIDFPEHFYCEVEVTPYKWNPQKFKRQMAALATALEKEGY